MSQQSMQALVFEGPGQLVLREWPVPRPQAGEMLVRVHTATICGTDLRIVSGRKTRDVRRGHPIGHECSGIVAAVGAGVDFSPGQAVAVHPVVTCGQCSLCQADCENLCPERITLGYHTDGAFAEYMLIPARAVGRGNIFKLPAQVNLNVASVLEPAGCCINGQHELGLLPAKTVCENLLICGAGPIGLLHLMIARAADPDVAITVLDPRASRRAAAVGLANGVDALDPQEFTAHEAFGAAILATGAPEAVNPALRALRKGGRINLFAGFDAGTLPPTDLNAIHYKQLHVCGASESRRRDFAEALDLLVRQRADFGRLITHHFRLAEYEQAFRAAADGAALKVALRP